MDEATKRYESEFAQTEDTVILTQDGLQPYDKNGYRSIVTPPFPKETVGFIVGWPVHTFGYLSFDNSTNRRIPGLYRNRQRPYVRFPDGRVLSVHVNNLMNRAAINRMRGLPRSLPQPHFLVAERIGDLPTTHIWEDDTVRIKDSYAKCRTINRLKEDALPDHPDCFRTTRLCVEENSEASFCLTDRLYKGGIVVEAYRGADAWRENELKLVERGNLWKRGHGEPLTFGDLQEEANFHSLIGEADEVIPLEHNQPTSLEDAMQMVADGRGHGLVCDPYEVDKAMVEAYKILLYRNKDLGARIAQATLNSGFLVHPDKKWMHDLSL